MIKFYKKNEENMKILVGLSGGVDSAVCALKLKQEGHEVIGATMSIWGDRGMMKHYTSGKNACFGPDEKEDIESARKIAGQIGIPYYVFDCKKEYEEIVLKNFKEEYIGGKTPNPCVWCNSLIKFKALPEIAKKEGLDFEKFATGHYARIEENEGKFYLKTASDPRKDQTYFLYRLKQEQLKNILMPLGTMTKEETRHFAKDFGLSVSDKKDSQDFYSGDYNELLGVGEKEGNIVNIEGKVLGKHKGIWNYTIGQRKGVGVSSSKPLYVLELRKDTNEVVVGDADKTFKKSLIADRLSFTGDIPKNGQNVQIKIRSAQKAFSGTVTINNGEAYVESCDLQKSVAPGQSVVLYDGETVLGGGIIIK